MSLLSQYFWPNDRRSYRLCRHVHALLHGRHAEELPPLCLPFSEFRGAVDAGGAVFEILEVSYCGLLLYFIILGGGGRGNLCRRIAWESWSKLGMQQGEWLAKTAKACPGGEMSVMVEIARTRTLTTIITTQLWGPRRSAQVESSADDGADGQDGGPDRLTARRAEGQEHNTARRGEAERGPGQGDLNDCGENMFRQVSFILGDNMGVERTACLLCVCVCGQLIFHPGFYLYHDNVKLVEGEVRPLCRARCGAGSVVRGFTTTWR